MDDFLHREIPKTELPEIRHVCPFCALPVDDTQTKCPRCGVPLKSEPEALQCPECGALAPAGSKSCPRCGVGFEEKPELPPTPSPPPSEGIVVPSGLAKPSKRPMILAGEVVTPPPDAGIKASSQGFINGRGAINGTGLVNGRGAINGTGLVNGTGMTNGTRLEGRLSAPTKRNLSVLRRWQFLAVLVALAIVIPSFVFLSYAHPSGPVVDGKFSDWAHIEKYGMQAPGPTPQLTVQEWAVQSQSQRLFMYLTAASDVMSSSDIDSFYLFVDSDNSASTGYRVSSLGADYMLEIHGWDRTVQSASLMAYTPPVDQFNWTGWTDVGALSAALKSDELEASADLPVALNVNAKFLLLSQNNLPNHTSSVSYPVPETGGVLVIRQEAGSGVILPGGTIPAEPQVPFIRLVLKCEGRAGTINSITPVISGAALVAPVNDIDLTPEVEKTVEVSVDSSSSPASQFIWGLVTKASVSSTFSDIIIVGDGVRSYVSSAPSSIQIDGAFADWNGRIAMDNDSLPVAGQNVNITAVGSTSSPSNSAFYVSVDGQMCGGTYVPAVRGKPSSMGGGGGGAVIPTRKTGEDLLRIYIDSDISNSTGQVITRGTKTIGADYLIEIKGINGEIVSKSLSHYSGTVWNAVAATISAAKDSQRIELSLPASSIGSASTIASIIETTDWHDTKDWALPGGLLDPWVIDAAGNAYMTNNGSTWTYLGTPTLEPGDRIVDIVLTQDSSEVFLVTNTGRTFYWILATSTSWTAGQTNPIDVATYSEAVSMSFYSSHNPSAWLLTKNGSYFWLMDAENSKKDWAFQNPPLVGITDYTDLVYAGGTMYALRSGPNTRLNYSSNGNSFTSVTSPTGSTSVQTDFTFISGGAGSSDDILFVLCENGKIRYSSDGGVSWSALGNLPTPTGSNQSKYIGMGFDSSGYMWIATDTGYCFKSTDTTTFSIFTYVGKSPIAGIIGIVPLPMVIPEFGLVLLPVVGTLGFVFMGRRRRIRP